MSDVLALPRPAGFGSITRDYLQLSKSRIVMMVLITTAAGYLFAAHHIDWTLLANTLIGTALVAASATVRRIVWISHDDGVPPGCRQRCTFQIRHGTG